MSDVPRTGAPVHILTFWWHNPAAKHLWNYEFTAEHVNRLQRGWARNLTIPHEFHCFVDECVGQSDIDTRAVDVIPMPEPWLDVLRRFGRAWPKLGVFGWQMRETFGAAKLLTVDLDMCLVGPCDELVRKGYETDFIGYMDTKNPRLYSGSLHMHTAGRLRQVWDTFSMVRELDTSMQEMVGSDQMWLTATLGENVWPRWNEADGIYDYWRIENEHALPENARIVMVNGMRRDVSLPAFQERHAWLRENWI